MDLKSFPVAENQRKKTPKNVMEAGFGNYFTDHMFLMEWDENNGWCNARIEKYHALSLEPSCIIFHYGQQAFEGMKAYITPDGRATLFRPMENLSRMVRTSQRLCLPEFDKDFVLNALKELVKLDRNWIPKNEGDNLGKLPALYIRPTMIGIEPTLGLKVSKNVLFYIIMCPVGCYYDDPLNNPVNIVAERKYTRAAVGGIGDSKTAGNYAASLFVEKYAKDQGFNQALWLDAKEHKYVEEVGSMNIFFVINNEIITPKLTGSILPGVTRKSVLELGRAWDLNMVERRISIDEIVDACNSGKLKEAFGAGTAAVISPVGKISVDGKDYKVGDGNSGSTARKFFDALTGIQYGRDDDNLGWREYID